MHIPVQSNNVTNHTDILGSKAASVINRIFHQHFPNAIRTAEALNFTWMTQSWLVSAYRHCNETIVSTVGGASQELVCPSESELQHFEDAVRKGKLTWHAFPFNAGTEHVSFFLN